MLEEYEIYQNDYGYDLNFTCYQAGGENRRNITGLTITLKMWLPGWPGSLKINSACTIDVAANGTCHYTLQDGDTDITGTFLAELEGTTTGYKDTLGQYKIIIKESG